MPHQPRPLRPGVLPAPITLPSGLIAEIIPDPWVPGAVQLVVDGTPQSHINLNDPTDLFFEYVRRIGHIIDLFRPASQPISALHLGAGACTLPRYIAATRPASRQQVLELEPSLVELVRRVAPLPQNPKIRVRYGDARATLSKLPSAMRGQMDLVIVDIFAGSQTPAHVSSREFYALVQPFLQESGAIVINAADGAGLPFVRGQIATLRECFKQVCAIGEPQVLKGRRFGNVVLLASNAPGDTWDWLPRLLAGGPHPARLLRGRELRELQGTTPVVTDSNASPSPAPAPGIFGR